MKNLKKISRVNLKNIKGGVNKECVGAYSYCHNQPKTQQDCEAQNPGQTCVMFNGGDLCPSVYCWQVELI